MRSVKSEGHISWIIGRFGKNFEWHNYAIFVVVVRTACIYLIAPKTKVRIQYASPYHFFGEEQGQKRSLRRPTVRTNIRIDHRSGKRSNITMLSMMVGEGLRPTQRPVVTIMIKRKEWRANLFEPCTVGQDGLRSIWLNVLPAANSPHRPGILVQ